MEETIIFEVNYESAQAQQNARKLEAEIVKLREALKANNAEYKKNNISLEDFAARQSDLKAELKSVQNEQRKSTREMALAEKATKAATNSYNQLSSSLALEENRLKELAQTLKLNEDGTLELNDAFQEQFEKVEKLRAAQLNFDKAIRNGRTNVGNYEESVTAALNNFTLLGVSLESVTDILKNPFQAAIAGVNAAFKALAANPIFAVLATVGVLLTAAFNAFSKTEEGAAKLVGALGMLNAILDPIIFGFEKLGDFVFGTLISGFEALAGVADSLFGTSIKEAGQLEGQLLRINEKIEKSAALQAQNNLEIERAKTQRDDEFRSFQARIAANEKVGKLIQKRLNEEVKLEESKLKILQKQLANTTSEGEKRRLNKEIAEQQAVVAEKKSDIEGQIVEQLTNQVSLYRDQRDAIVEVLDLQLERQIAEGQIAEGSKQELDLRMKRNQEVARTQIEALAMQAKLEIDTAGKTAEQIIAIVKKRNKTLADNQKINLQEIQKVEESLRIANANDRNKFNAAQVAAFQETQSKIAEAEAKRQEAMRNKQDAQNRENLAKMQVEVLKYEEGTQKRLEAEIAFLNTKKEISLQNEKLTESERLLIIKQTNEQAIKLSEEFEAKQEAIVKRELEAKKQIAAIEEAERASVFRKLLEAQNNFAAKTLEDETATNEQRLQALNSFNQTAIALLRQKNEQEIQAEIAKREALRESGELTPAEKELALLESNMRIQEIEAANQNAISQILSEGAARRAEISELEAQTRIKNAKAVSDALGQAASLFEEGTVAYKIFATSQAVINTFLGATQALADKDLPPLAKFIVVPAIIATGLAQVAKIQAAAEGAIIEEFSRGGRVWGAGSSKSDSVPAMLSAGEAVINAKSTKEFLPALDFINRSGGGKPLMAADGGLAGAAGGGVNSGFAAFETTTNAIKDITIVSRWTDLQEIEEQENNVIEFSEI